MFSIALVVRKSELSSCISQVDQLNLKMKGCGGLPYRQHMRISNLYFKELSLGSVLTVVAAVSQESLFP